MDTFALILVIIGALNWGCIGIFGFDVISSLLGGQGSFIARIVFALVGLCGLWAIKLLFNNKSSH